MKYSWLCLSFICFFHVRWLRNGNWQELSLDWRVSQLVCNTLYWLVSRCMWIAFCLRYTSQICTFTDLSWTNAKVNSWEAQPYNAWGAKLQDILWGKKHKCRKRTLSTGEGLLLFACVFFLKESRQPCEVFFLCKNLNGKVLSWFAALPWGAD